MPEITHTKTDAVSEYIIELISSKALPDSGKIPSENILSKKLNVSRVTVRRAIAELAFKGVLRTERGRGSFAIGYKNLNNPALTVPLIVSSLEADSRFLDICSGAQNYLSKKNIGIALSSSDFRVANEKKSVTAFFEEGHRNMLVLPVALEDSSEFYRSFIKKGVNFVFIDQKPPELPCNYVHSDNFSGGYDITEHLISLGHRRIAYIYQEFPEISSSTNARISGYKSALKAHGISQSSELICYTNRTICDKTLEHLLSLSEPPTAFFANNDFLAQTIYELLTLKGISVPEDISLTGFDNITNLLNDVPDFTTVDQDFYAMGYNAAKRLCGIIEKHDGILKDIAIPVKPIFRKTTDKPKDL